MPLPEDAPAFRSAARSGTTQGACPDDVSRLVLIEGRVDRRQNRHVALPKRCSSRKDHSSNGSIGCPGWDTTCAANSRHEPCIGRHVRLAFPTTLAPRRVLISLLLPRRLVAADTGIPVPGTTEGTEAHPAPSRYNGSRALRANGLTYQNERPGGTIHTGLLRRQIWHLQI